MADRKKAREFAQQFAKLAIDVRHSPTASNRREYLLQAQELYDAIVVASHDFSTTELAINDFLWELEIIPTAGDPLYEPQRENSLWKGTTPDDWKRIKDLDIGHVVESLIGARILILSRTSDRLFSLHLATKRRGALDRFVDGQHKVKVLKTITKRLTEKINKGDRDSLDELIASIP